MDKTFPFPQAFIARTVRHSLQHAFILFTCVMPSTPQVDKTFPFDQAAQAHKYAEDGLNRNGKVVIVVDPTLK